MGAFWHMTYLICALDFPATENWKIQTLPLARIKKIMKSEEFILQELEKDKQQKAAEDGQGAETDKPNVKFMISGEAPVLMSKACELLIKDLSFRAWRHTERNRRRTLQRQDLHAAVGESEVYDFLIDIVPRVTTPKASVPNPTDAATAAAMASTMQQGAPMAGIPTGLPSAHGAPAVSQPMPGMVDNNTGMVQQMHHHQPQAPGQLQQGVVQYSDQQQQYQTYMVAPQVNIGDINQGTVPMPAAVGPPGQVQHPQPATQWMTHALPNSGSTAQS
jgi:nuclear transcription factor Y gamma